MGRRFKVGMSRMFRVSLLSCHFQNDAEVSPQTMLVVRRESRDLHPNDSSSSAPNPAASRHLPATVRSGSTTVKSCLKTRPLKADSEREREVLPPAPPASPAVPCTQLEGVDEKKKGKWDNKERKTKKMSKGEETSGTTVLTTTTASSTDSPCYFSSEEEGQMIGRNRKTFSSLKSFSSSESDSSSEAHRPCQTPKRQTRRRKPKFSKQSSHSRPLESASKAKVEESVAVTKRSTDPYADFRSSMVEMIIEKQIVSVEDLEQLLDSFLSLNSPYYHRVILDAFEEICEALFSNWC